MARLLEQRAKHLAPSNAKKKPCAPVDDGSTLAEPTPGTLENLFRLESIGKPGRVRRARLDATEYGPDSRYFLRNESDEEAWHADPSTEGGGLRASGTMAGTLSFAFASTRMPPGCRRQV